jgi:hypothetical protein
VPAGRRLRHLGGNANSDAECEVLGTGKRSACFWKPARGSSSPVTFAKARSGEVRVGRTIPDARSSRNCPRAALAAKTERYSHIRMEAKREALQAIWKKQEQAQDAIQNDVKAKRDCSPERVNAQEDEGESLQTGVSRLVSQSLKTNWLLR